MLGFRFGFRLGRRWRGDACGGGVGSGCGRRRRRHGRHGRCTLRLQGDQAFLQQLPYGLYHFGALGLIGVGGQVSREVEFLLEALRHAAAQFGGESRGVGRALEGRGQHAHGHPAGQRLRVGGLQILQGGEAHYGGIHLLGQRGVQLGESGQRLFLHGFVEAAEYVYGFLLAAHHVIQGGQDVGFQRADARLGHQGHLGQGGQRLGAPGVE